MNGIARSSFGMILGFAITCIGGGGAAADAFSVDGISINLPVPSGYCFLSRENEVDRAYFDFQDKLRATQDSKIVAAAVPCSSVAALRSGSDDVYSFVALWLVDAPNGKVSYVPSSYTREALLGELANAMPKLDTAQIAKNARDAAKTVGQSIDVKSIGVIDQDRNAVYLGGHADYGSSSTEHIENATVAGMTLLRNRVVSFSLASPFHGRATYDSLLAEVKKVIAAAVASNVNPQPDQSLPKGMASPHSTSTPTSGYSFDLSRAVGNFIAWGVLAVVFGGIAWLLKLRKKTRKNV